VRRDRYKLIHDSKSDHYALFDLSVDPGELVDIAAELPEVTAVLQGELEQRHRMGTDSSAKGREAPEGPKVELSDEEMDELRALGYVP
jgi:arylsulfatase A-like enzyme